MTTHAEARAFATAALAKRFGTTPTAGEVRALAGIGLIESHYGDGFGDKNNIGAVQKGKGWTGETFIYTDTHPNADGTSTKYETEFRKYPTRQAGWEDFALEAYSVHGRSSVRAAAKANDWAGVSRALHDTGYYEGFGATVEERIAHHVKALTDAINSADKAIGNMMATTPSIEIRVQNPQGDLIGTAAISDVDAPGLSQLAGIYGAPVLIAYPNGWRFLKFAPEVQIPARTGLPFKPVEQDHPLSFGAGSGAAIGILGIVVTIFVATLQSGHKRLVT
jgi:hypothetical protein